MTCTVTNTVEQWYHAARIMGLTATDAHGAARETSKKPDCTAIVLKRDGSKTIYREGKRVES